jgi:hypothetical protein
LSAHERPDELEEPLDGNPGDREEPCADGPLTRLVDDEMPSAKS